MKFKLLAAFVVSSGVSSPPSLVGQGVDGMIDNFKPDYQSCVNVVYQEIKVRGPHLIDNPFNKALTSLVIRKSCLEYNPQNAP